MDYAVVLYFDEKSDNYISVMMKNICNAGVNSYMLDVGIRPHITLAIFRGSDPRETSLWLRSYAGKAVSFKMGFSSIGLFPGTSSVLFLAPVIERGLLHLHRIFNEQLKEFAADFESCYLPGKWVPHCTLATHLNPAELHLALEASVKDFEPLSVMTSQIGFIQCNPFKEIVTFDLIQQ